MTEKLSGTVTQTITKKYKATPAFLKHQQASLCSHKVKTAQQLPTEQTNTDQKFAKRLECEKVKLFGKILSSVEFKAL